HRVADVDTGRTIDTLHLDALPDIDSRGAYMHTELTVNTVAQHPRVVSFSMSTRFTAFVVVRHRNTPVVEQHALQPAVRAHRRADDLPRKGKHTVECQGKQHHRRESADVLPNGVRGNGPNLRRTDDIRQEHVGNDKRNHQENAVLGRLPGVPECVARGRIQPFLLLPVALNPILYPPEYQFHKNRLGTRPPAPDTSVHHGKQHDADHRDEHTEHKNVQVLWPKHASKQHKLAVNHVEQQQRLTAYPHQRRGQQKEEEGIAHPLAVAIQGPGGLLRIDPRPVHPFPGGWYSCCFHDTSFCYTIRRFRRHSVPAHPPHHQGNALRGPADPSHSADWYPSGLRCSCLPRLSVPASGFVPTAPSLYR